MNRIKPLVGITALLFALILLTPSATFAQGLVPCEDGTACNACDLITLANSVITWLIGVLTVVFAVLVMVAGLKLVTSGGNPSAKTEAKGMMTNAFIGFVLVLAAWVIIDTLMRTLLPSGTVNGVLWYQSIDCSAWGQSVPDVIPYSIDIEEGPTAQWGGGTSVSPVGVSGMTSLRSAGVNVANWHGINGPNRTDLVHPSVAQATLWMQNQGRQQNGGRLPFQVTAAYTNGVGHSANSQHYRGTAVDLQPINGFSYDRLIALCRQAGFTFVNDERSANHIHCDMR